MKMKKSIEKALKKALSFLLVVCIAVGLLSTAVFAAEDAPAPVNNSEPAGEPAPAEDPAPVDPASIEDPAPVDPASTEDPAPADPAPAEDPAPADPAPAEDPAPVDPAPAEDPAPVDPAPAEDPAPADPAPAEDPAPVDPAPAEDPAPVDPAPAEDPAPADPAPAEDPAPVDPAADDTNAIDDADVIVSADMLESTDVAVKGSRKAMTRASVNTDSNTDLNVENKAVTEVVDDSAPHNWTGEIVTVGDEAKIDKIGSGSGGSGTTPIQIYVKYDSGWQQLTDVTLTGVGVESLNTENVAFGTVYPLSTPIEYKDVNGNIIYFSYLKYENLNNSGDGKGCWHMDGFPGAEQDVRMIISDTTGQINEVTEKTIADWSSNRGESGHEFDWLKFDLPDPETYGQYTDGRGASEKGGTISNIYIPTAAQMNEIKRAVGDIEGLNNGDGSDGTITWQFRRVYDDYNGWHWDLEGLYTPKNINIYIYVTGDNMADDSTDNGRVVDIYDQTDAGNSSAEGVDGKSKWHTVGKIKISIEEIEEIYRKYGITENIYEIMQGNVDKYLKDNENLAAANKAVEELVIKALGEKGYAAYNGNTWGSYEGNFSWFGLKVVGTGADNYVKGNYLTLHLNGYIPKPTPTPTPNQTPNPTPPTPSRPRTTVPDDTPVVPDEVVPLAELPVEVVEIADPEVPLTELPVEVVEIADSEVPLAELPVEVVEIADPEVPLAGSPRSGLTEIFDEDVPLADIPKTGDDFLIWEGFALISGMGLAWLALKDYERRRITK